SSERLFSLGHDHVIAHRCRNVMPSTGHYLKRSCRREVLPAALQARAELPSRVMSGKFDHSGDEFVMKTMECHGRQTDCEKDNVAPSRGQFGVRIGSDSDPVTARFPSGIGHNQVIFQLVESEIGPHLNLPRVTGVGSDPPYQVCRAHECQRVAQHRTRKTIGVQGVAGTMEEKFVAIGMREKKLNGSLAGASSQHDLWMLEETGGNNPILWLRIRSRVFVERH